jgi:hypothetical protein
MVPCTQEYAKCVCAYIQLFYSSPWSTFAQHLLHCTRYRTWTICTSPSMQQLRLAIQGERTWLRIVSIPPAHVFLKAARVPLGRMCVAQRVPPCEKMAPERTGARVSTLSEQLAGLKPCTHGFNCRSTAENTPVNDGCKQHGSSKRWVLCRRNREGSKDGATMLQA